MGISEDAGCGGVCLPLSSIRQSIRPHIAHAGQGHKVGLHTPTILGGNSHLNWFHDRGAIKDLAHTGTTKGIAQAIKRGPIRKFLPNYANVYVTIQSHALSAGVQTHYIIANGARNGLTKHQLEQCQQMLQRRKRRRRRTKKRTKRRRGGIG